MIFAASRPSDVVLFKDAGYTWQKGIYPFYSEAISGLLGTDSEAVTGSRSNLMS